MAQEERPKHANREETREFSRRQVMMRASRDGNAGFLSHMLEYIGVQDLLKTFEAPPVNEPPRLRELTSRRVGELARMFLQD